MIANMNEKGRQVKLLAAIAIFAMVVCTFAVILPSGEVSAADTSSDDEAKIGNVSYGTFEDAISASKNNDTIEILKNIDIDAAVVVTNKTITIDLNGYTINSTQTYDKNKNGYVIIAGDKSDVTINGPGKITNSFVEPANDDDPKATGILEATTGGTLTVERVTVEAKQYGIIAFGYDTTSTGNYAELRNVDIDSNTEFACHVYVNNSTITSPYGALSTNGNNGLEYIEINNSTINCAKGTAVYVPSNAKVVISGCTINAQSGVDQRTGYVEVSNTDIKYTGPGVNKGQGDGPTAFGVGVAIIDASGYSTAKATTIISDVKFTGGTGTIGDVVMGVPRNNSEDTTVNSILAATSVANRDGYLSIDGMEFYTTDSDTIGVSYMKDGNINVGQYSTFVVTGDVALGESKTLTIGTEAKAYVVKGASLSGGNVDKLETIVDYNTETTGTASSEAEFIAQAGSGATITVSADITLTQDVVLSNGTNIVMGDHRITVSDTCGLIVSDGAIFTGRVQSDANNVINISGVTGEYNVYAGSIEITGNYTADNGIIKTYGNVVISGSLDGELTIENLGGTVTFNDFTVNSGSEIILTGTNNDFDVTGKFYLYGALMVPVEYDGELITVTVDSNSEFKAFSNATISPFIDVVGKDDTSKIDLGEAMGVQYIRQDVTSNLVYSQTQTVIIEESIIIKKGASLTVNGQLIVNEGVEVIIEDGGKLIVNNQTAKVTINGTVTVENGGAMSISSAEAVDVAGTIASDGILTINSNVTVKDGGNILVDDGDKSVFTIEGESSKLAIDAGGNVEIRGQATVNDITNKGTVTLNGAILNGNVKISQAADGAIVDIKSFSAKGTNSLTITDNGLVFKDNKDSSKIIKVDGTNYVPNTLTIEGTEDVGIKGLVITESVTSKTVNKTTTYYNSLILSGSIGISDETPLGYDGIKQVDVEGPSIDVTDALTIAKNVTLNLKSGNLDVSGTITATADKATIVAKSGDINVSGMIETGVKIENNINAFSYEGTVEGDSIYYYTTLKTAIDNGQTDIEALGATSVLDSVDIPSGTTVKAGKEHKSITIGSTDARDVLVTVKDGGEFRSCIIDVMGTLTFDNKRNDRNNTITSDVFVEGDVSKSYTNIYTALNNAQSGETVTIYRTGSNVILDKDVTINDGVTLDIPSGKGVTINDNVTVTVNGTIRLSGNLVAQNVGFNPDSDNHSTIIVNGAFMSVNEIVYSDTSDATVDYYIPGAYYNLVNTTGNWNYVTPVEDAATVSNDVTEGKIDIYGTNQVGDVAFTGDENQHVYITVYGKLTASSFKLTYAEFSVADDANNYQFDGTITSDVGSIEFVNSNGFVVTSSVDAENATIMNISGTPAQVDVEGADAKVVISSGNVSVINSNEQGDDLTITGVEFVIAEEATLTVDGTNAKLVAKDLAVDGTLVAYNGGNVTADNVYVIGTFTVSAADNENNIHAGSATVNNDLRVGISDDFKTTTAAALNADKIDGWDNIYVSAESTITENLVKNKANTQFFVEDSLWFTVYANTTADISVITPDVIPTDNALLKQWTGKDVNGVSDSFNGGELFSIGVFERLDADINYDIYTVTVFADPGITAVYIDGKLMTSGYFWNPLGGTDNVTMAAGFQAFVSAGEHEITYKLGNYFSGEATMTVNGQSVTGNTFTTSGMPEDGKTSVDYVVYLQGIEASAPETPSTGGDDGMGLTDYLLIVLVILIVIMAIMVALRLMRS